MRETTRTFSSNDRNIEQSQDGVEFKTLAKCMN